jgi:hypothetical protein
MIRTSIVAAVLVVSLVSSRALLAHEGHTHKVMGTVQSVQGSSLEVKTPEGKTVTVMMDAKTSIVRGTTKLDRTALKAGDRVSIDATEQKKVMTAQTIKLGTAPAAPQKAPAKAPAK